MREKDLRVIRLLAMLLAVGFFVYAGSQMTKIESVSGDSIAEAFYQAFGWFSYGLAAVSVVIGLPLRGWKDERGGTE